MALVLCVSVYKISCARFLIRSLLRGYFQFSKNCEATKPVTLLEGSSGEV